MVAASDPQWAFAGIITTALVAPTWLGWLNSRKARRNTQPNGGSSPHDALINELRALRTESAQRHLDNLDRFATVVDDLETLKHEVADIDRRVARLEHPPEDQ